MPVQVVRREQPRYEVDRHEHRRVIKRPAPEQHVERRAPERAEQCRRPIRRARTSPAPPRAPSAPLLAILRQPARPRHRPGRCARDAVDVQPRLLHQAVQHAPGEGAVRAATLQREVHQNGRTVERLGFPRLAVVILAQAFRENLARYSGGSVCKVSPLRAASERAHCEPRQLHDRRWAITDVRLLFMRVVSIWQ